MPAHAAHQERRASTRSSRREDIGPKIVFRKSGGWWAVSMPAFPGAYSQGKTKHEAIANLWDAVAELALAHRQLARSEARRSSRKMRRAA